jgi:hypothetical protein
MDKEQYKRNTLAKINSIIAHYKNNRGSGYTTKMISVADENTIIVTDNRAIKKSLAKGKTISLENIDVNLMGLNKKYCLIFDNETLVNLLQKCKNVMEEME